MLTTVVSLVFVVFGLDAAPPGSSPNNRVYIGTYTTYGSKGIYSATFDEKTGLLSHPTLAASTIDPSFLAFHPRLPMLYSVNEGADEVSSFAISRSSGALKSIDHVPTGGGGPCFLALDRMGRMLVAANYGGGSFSTFPILSNGRIGPRASLVHFTGSGPNPKRQQSPHAHYVYFTPDNRFLLVTDLGTDRIMVYRIHLGSATVEPADPPFAMSNPGSGPRHFVFSLDGKTAYVLNEVQSTVSRFAIDARSGAMRLIDTVSALPPGFRGDNTAGEIALGPGARTLVVSNRGDDSLVVFAIASTGLLHQIQRIPSGGKTPRHFTFDPTGRWLLAANQDSANISVFRVDAASGRLAATSKSVEVPEPVCLLFSRFFQ